MIIELSKKNGESTFDAPEGRHLGRCTGHKEIDGKVRIYFSLDNPDAQGREVKAGRTFEASLIPGSALRTFIDDWLGRDFVEQTKTVGGFNLDALNNQPAVLNLVHCRNEDYEKPYVFIESADSPSAQKKDVSCKILAPSIKPMRTKS